jgi:hypothetical protein
MSGEHEIDKSFPYFEEHIFSGWLIQFKAIVRAHDCDEVRPHPGRGGNANGRHLERVCGSEGRARFCVQEGCFFPCKMTPVSPHSTPPRLRTGESMHLVSFWPSPTSRARRERQRRASGTRWWVGRKSPVLCAGGVLLLSV